MPIPRLPIAAICVTLLSCALAGCANPGPPKPPSLQIPAIVRDLSAARRGNAVELQFTLPQRTSDGTGLKSSTLSVKLCRAVDAGGCAPLSGTTGSFPVPKAPKTMATLRDVLPPTLRLGPPRLLTYRVELSNPQGKGAGFSDPAYAVAGAAPAAVTDLRALGSRLGVVLTWQHSTTGEAEVLLRREDLSPAGSQHSPRPAARDSAAHDRSFYADPGKGKPEPRVVLLNAGGDSQVAMPNRNADSTLDTTALAETPYRYTAERRQRLEVSGHNLEMRSDASAPILFTLHDTFPPPPPTDLNVAGFAERNANGQTMSFAVDLIWEPVQDEQLAGYKVYRQAVDSQASEEKKLLTPEPTKLPAFRDITASDSRRYRYSVTSIDLKGNESEAATAVLEPQVF